LSNLVFDYDIFKAHIVITVYKFDSNLHNYHLAYKKMDFDYNKLRIRFSIDKDMCSDHFKMRLSFDCYFDYNSSYFEISFDYSIEYSLSLLFREFN